MSNVTNTPDKFSWFALRRIFYLVTPEETRFADIKSVPNWIDDAGALFATLMVTEMLVLQLTGKHDKWAWNDTITNNMAGVLSMIFKFMYRGMGMTAYVYVYSHLRLVDLPWDSNWTWLLAFLSQDLAYYLWHRALHEFGFFWSFHQTHHSSEYMNISVALRQGMLQEFASGWFELWQALFVPPQVHLVHRYLSTLNQFWVHTELLPKLGPLEWVFNTPSHHRVHHGRNAYCIDKNYGGTLIIWDRLFGTFSEEKHEEPVAYGLVHNVNTFDQLKVQFSGFKELLWDKPMHWLPEGSSWKERALAYIYPVGWMPGTKLNWFIWWRLADTEEGIPEVERPVVKYSPVLPVYRIYYVVVQYVIHLSVYHSIRDHWTLMSPSMAALCVIYQLIGIQSLSYLLENKWYAQHFELFKCVFAATASLYGLLFIHGKFALLLLSMVFSAAYWITAAIQQRPRSYSKLVD